MKPRHADLFATDLDDETLIRYIDRFLMFYVRTADRLQRTSVWLDNLEGGHRLPARGGDRGQSRHRCRARGADGRR
jgi:NAD(P)H-nitrite reductase large subunit